MEPLPEQCKQCAEYGSKFCEDCLEEENKKLKEKVKLSETLRNIANNKRKRK